MDLKYIEVSGLNSINAKEGEGYEVISASLDSRGIWTALMRMDNVTPMLKDALVATLPAAILAALDREKLPPIDPASISKGVGIIALERRRQIEREGYDPDHDDNEHAEGDLAMAAMCYACEPNKAVRTREYTDPGTIPDAWPWQDGWKPTPQERVKELAKAGALIAAEIDRILREDERDGAELDRIRNDPDDNYVDGETALKGLGL